MSRPLALTGLVLLLGGCAGLPPRLSNEKVIPRILPSTVQIIAERQGTRVRASSGVVIHAEQAVPRSYILTTRHSLAGLEGDDIYVMVGRRPRSSRRAVPVATAEDLDLALVRVEGVALPVVSLGDDARLGDDVWVVGYPWGRRVTLVKGVVSQVDPGDAGEDLQGATVMIDASVSYGASGGGVFEAATARLIGVVEGYRTARMSLRGDPASSVDFPVPGETYVIPVRAIRRFLEASGYGQFTRR